MIRGVVFSSGFEHYRYNFNYTLPFYLEIIHPKSEPYLVGTHLGTHRNYYKLACIIGFGIKKNKQQKF